MLTILFFASLKETLNCDKLTIDASANIKTIDDLKTQLMLKSKSWQKALSNPLLLAAVNQEIASIDTNVTSGDEIAFFPPVTGG